MSELYLLDTCVVSEIRKKERMDSKVATWFFSVPSNNLFLSVLTIGEIRRGVEEKRLTDPVQADHLDRWMEKTKGIFLHHTLPIATSIADRWGRLCIGQRLPMVDGYIAATALEHDLTVVTRNTADFARSGCKLLNPWE